MPDPGDGATDAGLSVAETISAWADGRIAAGEALPSRDPRHGSMATVALREVTAETVRAVCAGEIGGDEVVARLRL